MIPKLKNFQKFIYRNSHEIHSFEVTNDFLFICTSNEVHQYSLNKTVPIVGKLDFTATFSAFCIDRFFLASKKNLYYFKYKLYKLCELNALTLCFFVENKLISVDEHKLKVYLVVSVKDTNDESNNEKDKSIREDINVKDKNEKCGKEGDIELAYESIKQDLNVKCEEDKSINENCTDVANCSVVWLNDAVMDNNGLCSAHCISNNLIFLGFENGKVGCFSVDSICNPKISLDIKCDLKEPIISIVVANSLIFSLTLSGVYVSSKESGTSFTAVKGRQLILYKNNLILVQDRRIVVLGFDLVILNTFLSLSDIKQVKVKGDSLYVGFSNGLLIEYTSLCQSM